MTDAELDEVRKLVDDGLAIPAIIVRGLLHRLDRLEKSVCSDCRKSLKNRR